MRRNFSQLGKKIKNEKKKKNPRKRNRRTGFFETD